MDLKSGRQLDTIYVPQLLNLNDMLCDCELETRHPLSCLSSCLSSFATLTHGLTLNIVLYCIVLDTGHVLTYVTAKELEDYLTRGLEGE